MNTKDYNYWRAKLSGESIGAHPDDPQCGFYSMKRGGELIPAAIWRDESGDLIASVDGKKADASEIWTWVANRPVKYAEFKERADTGRWPGEADVKEIGAYSSAGKSDVMLKEIKAIEQAAEEIGIDNIGAQETADKAASLAVKLTDIAKVAENYRKAEKQPHLDADRAVDEKWKPIIDLARAKAKEIKSAITVFMKKANAPAKQAGGWDGKRKVAMRTRKVAEITDYDAALAHYGQKDDVKKLIQRLANADARAGVEAPGCKIITEEYVA